jgi:hypothetical protein
MQLQYVSFGVDQEFLEVELGRLLGPVLVQHVAYEFTISVAILKVFLDKLKVVIDDRLIEMAEAWLSLDG